MSGLAIAILARDPRRAKTRLAAHLGPAERAALATAMAADVVAAARRARPRARLLLVSDSRALARAMPGTECVVSAARGTRAAARAIVTRLAREGIDAVLVLPADVPFVRPADIRAVLRAGRTAAVVVVPDRRRSGTNALYLRPPRIIEPRFGPRSFAAHRAAGRGVVLRTVAPAGLRLDVDTPADLRALLGRAAAAGSRTRAALRAIRAHASRAAPSTRRGSPSPRAARSPRPTARPGGRRPRR